MAVKSAKKDREHLFIVEDDKGKREVLLDKPVYSIGREKKCDIRLYSKLYSSSISRRHATLMRKSQEDGSVYYQIVDGDSQGKVSVNGLRINGAKLQSHNLTNGDEIVFAPQVLATYQLRGDVELPRRSALPTAPPSDDPYDITLIDPSMMDGDEE